MIPNLKIPSPLEYITITDGQGWSKNIWIKRDDLIDPEISGNKWRKLKGNVDHCLSEGYGRLITIGGAFSNHLSAAASVSHRLGVQSIGLVKSGILDSKNPTLQFCKSKGMELIRVDRGWTDDDSIEMAIRRNAYWIPEGGSNLLGIQGVKDVVDEILGELSPVMIFTSVGSGGTLAGLRSAFPNDCHLIGVSAFDRSSLWTMLQQRFDIDWQNTTLLTHDVFGRFGRYHSDLVDFADQFYTEHDVILDPIYTTKTMHCIIDFLKNSDSEVTGPIVFYHSGGLQGWQGFDYRFKGRKLPHFLHK